MIVPEAVRSVLVGRLSSKQKQALPAVLETDRVYRPLDPALGSQHPTLRVLIKQDGDEFYLDYYSHSDDASSHRRIRMDGSVTALENYDGQFGTRSFPDPADTAREDQRVAAHNRRVAEVLRDKGFED
jgi:hypothetical protein